MRNRLLRCSLLGSAKPWQRWGRSAWLVRWLLLLVLWLLPLPAQAGDPELVWRSVETTHFRITYHEPLGRVAQRLARITELAHAALAPVLLHSPRFRTEVLITDDTDYSNGSATALPFPTVRLYLTAPDDRSELNDYDDWLYALFVHEYTHILHLDTVNGAPKWVNYLLGLGVNTLYAPNQIQPRWFIEGLAVFEETERTSAGRLRSTLFDMYLRSHVLEGKFLRLDQVTNQTRLFPRGNVPYLYGSAFLRFLAGRFGEQTLQKISHRYGGCWSPDCWVPWGLNRVLRKLTGATYGPLYDDFAQSLKDRYTAQQQQIAQQPLGLTVGVPQSDWKLSVDRPVFTDGGRTLLWLDSDPYQRPALWRQSVANLTTGAVAKRPHFGATVDVELDGVSGLSVSSDGKTAVMARLRLFRSMFSYQDLVLYRRDRREMVPLTEGLRIDNPALSPDGKLVAFEVNALGTRRLGVMPLPDAKTSHKATLIDPRAQLVPEVWRARAAQKVSFPLPQREFSQVYTPAWSPDGKQLALSYWQEGGFRDIVTLDVATGELRYITHDRALDLEPHYSADGKYLYFVSDRTGVYNLYAHHLATDTTFQVTNTIAGVFNPAVSPDGKLLAYVGFVSEGYRVETMELDPTRFVLAKAAPEDRPEASLIPEAELDPDKRLPVHRYNPARTFFRTPLSLLSLTLPISAPGPYGQSLGLQFSTADLVGLHSLVAGLTLQTDRADATGFFARYTYSRLWNPLYLDFSRSLTPRGGLRYNGQNRTYDEQALTVAVGTDLPLLRDVARSLGLSASYNFTSWSNKSPRQPSGPDDISLQLPEVGRYAALNLSLVYSDARRFQFSVGPEQGRYLSLGLAVSHPALGSQYQLYALRLVAAQYVGIPWPWRWAKNHTLQLGYEGGFSGGDLKRRGIFYLGGFPSSEDYLRAALLGLRPGQAKLRGYDPGATYGDQLHVLNIEYRFPLWWLERGYQTVPAFLWRLHGAVYSDVGAAFFGKLTADKLKASVGGELRLDGNLGYYLPFMFQLGYAHGFMDGANHRVYFLLNSPL
jgi:Tol biopolymer transport system component